MSGKAKAIIAAVAFLAAFGTAGAAPVDGEESYGLLFRTGTLDDIDRGNALTYQRDVVSKLKPEAQDRDTGKVVLKFRDDDTMAQLEFRQGQKHRGLGVFPASVGNPMIMYFYESVVRDMAEAAGGSPFYIRNRVKEALTQPGDLETGQAIFDGKTIDTKTIQLFPFESDPNRARMQGFGDLVLSVTMSDEVPGWYLSLIAEAKGEDGPVYRSMLVFDGLEPAQ